MMGKKPVVSDQLLDSIRIVKKPRNFLIYSTGAIAVLVLMSLFAVAIGGPEVIHAPLQADQPKNILVHAFFLNREGNIPTLFNYSLLVVASGLLFFVARVAFLVEHPWRYHWLVLGFIFLLLSFDEAARLHEQLIVPLRQLFNATGLFFYAWVVPGLAFVAIFALVFLNFLRALPVRVAGVMFLGGALFVAGAIGMEMIGGWVAASGLGTSWSYVFATTIEEALEMFGVAVFCTALLMLLSEGANSKYGYFTEKDPHTHK